MDGRNLRPGRRHSQSGDGSGDRQGSARLDAPISTARSTPRRRASTSGGRYRPSTATRRCARSPTSSASARRDIAKIMSPNRASPSPRRKGETCSPARHHRLVRRGGAPHLRPHRAAAHGQCRAARDEGAGRPGGRLHALELPDQPGGAQGLGGAGGGLLDHRQGAGGDARLAAWSWSAPMSTPACRRASSIWCSACRRKSRNISSRIRSSARSRFTGSTRSASIWPRSPAST